LRDRHNATDSNDYIVERVSAGTFPRPTSDRVWLIDDKADNLDAPEMHPMAGKPRSNAISVQSIIGATQNVHGLTTALKRLCAGDRQLSSTIGYSDIGGMAPLQHTPRRRYSLVSSK
jgi:hypothetical protein